MVAPPTTPIGVMTRIVVDPREVDADRTVADAAPKVTDTSVGEETAGKLWSEIATLVPPATSPLDGCTRSTTGGTRTYVNEVLAVSEGWDAGNTVSITVPAALAAGTVKYTVTAFENESPFGTCVREPIRAADTRAVPNVAIISLAATGNGIFSTVTRMLAPPKTLSLAEEMLDTTGADAA